MARPCPSLSSVSRAALALTLVLGAVAPGAVASPPEPPAAAAAEKPPASALVPARKKKPRHARLTRKQSAAARRWVAYVRQRLFRSWEVPKGLDAKARERLAADVEIVFDARGRIESWSLKAPAQGDGAAAFNESVVALGKRVKRLPRPPKGALALFLKRRLVLRMRANSPLLPSR